jgi:Mg2+ and Co2+ transporter CorA
MFGIHPKTTFSDLPMPSTSQEVEEERNNRLFHVLFFNRKEKDWKQKRISQTQLDLMLLSIITLNACGIQIILRNKKRSQSNND